MIKLKKLEPFWAVGPRFPCLLVTPLQCIGKKGFVQLGFHISGMTIRSYFFMNPLFMRVLGEQTIGTNVSGRILPDAISEVLSHFPGAVAVPACTSGPLTALFPEKHHKLAFECSQQEPLQPKPEASSKILDIPVPRFPGVVFAKNNMEQRRTWELESQEVLERMREYGFPFLRFETYFQVIECGGLTQ